jgi:hypothetical protein
VRQLGRRGHGFHPGIVKARRAAARHTKPAGNRIVTLANQ